MGKARSHDCLVLESLLAQWPVMSTFTSFYLKDRGLIDYSALIWKGT